MVDLPAGPRTGPARSDASDNAPAGGPATLVVMGVSGSGKTTVASLLAERLGRPMLEGDDVHSPAAVESMSSGHPLTDADRWPWLRRIRDWIAQRSAAGTPGIVTCSALKRSYRELLSGMPDVGTAPARVVFVYLHVGREELHRRLAARTGHFMKAGMLDSQLAALEPPAPGEDAITVDATDEPSGIADRIIREVGAG